MRNDAYAEFTAIRSDLRRVLVDELAEFWSAPAQPYSSGRVLGAARIVGSLPYGRGARDELERAAVAAHRQLGRRGVTCHCGQYKRCEPGGLPQPPAQPLVWIPLSKLALGVMDHVAVAAAAEFNGIADPEGTLHPSWQAPAGPEVDEDLVWLRQDGERFFVCEQDVETLEDIVQDYLAGTSDL